MSMYDASPAQLAYIENNRKRLHIERNLFDRWIVKRYGVMVAKLDKAQAHDLLELLIPAKDVPAEILDLAGIKKPAIPGFEGL